MYTNGNKKILNMLILEILKEYSDEEHPLTQQKIIQLLKSNYDVECDRRSVKNNALSLIDMGYEISMEDGYYLITREFENAELRLLIDSVLASKNMTTVQARTLVEKLKKQGNRYFQPKVSHVCNLPDMKRADNKQFLYVLDSLNDAIDMKRKVSFTYNSYGTDFKLHPKREEKYVVNPYQMVVANGLYYLIGNYDKYDDLIHFRIDRITNVEILDEKVKPLRQIKGQEQGLNLPKHMAEHIYMFAGESVYAQIEVSQDLMNDMVDWFGTDFQILTKEENKMTIRVHCNRSALIYWALQYGLYVTVIAPADVKEEIGGLVREMYEKYNM